MGIGEQRGKKKGEGGYGQGRAIIAEGDDVLLDEEKMVEHLLACIEAPDYGPPTLPAVAVELMQLSQIVCRYTPIDGGFAFMAGLLHDVGIAGTLLALSDRKGRRKSPPDLIAIWPAVDRVHQRAGEIMAQHWDLPGDLRLAISAHHQVLIQGHAHPLAATVTVANELAHLLGSGILPKADQALTAMSEDERDCIRAHTSVDRSGSETLRNARTALGLDEPTLNLIREESVALLAQLPT